LHPHACTRMQPYSAVFRSLSLGIWSVPFSFVANTKPRINQPIHV
jgi:hypothetical protein